MGPVEIPIPGPDQIAGFFLILTRIGAAIALTPVVSSKAIPLRIKAMLAVFLAFATISVVPLPPELGALSIPGLFLLMLKEAVIGLAIGLALGAIVAAWAMGGAVIDLMTGFSYGGVIDPQYGNQSSVIQQVYVLIAGAIFITIGGERWLIEATVTSFRTIPLLDTVSPADLLQIALSVATAVFVVGLGVIAPVLIALLLSDVAFGLIARAAPQTQVMQLEFPAKIGVALLVIILTLPWMVPYFTRASTELLKGVF